MANLENNQDSSRQHGGARKGAGRKTGSATKKTREIANKAAEEGLTPLEVMLFAMRSTLAEAQAAIDEQKGAERIAMPLGLLADAAALAKDAAPYMHPKLAAIEHSGPDGAPIPLSVAELSSLSGPELDTLKKLLAKGKAALEAGTA